MRSYFRTGCVVVCAKWSLTDADIAANAVPDAQPRMTGELSVRTPQGRMHDFTFTLPISDDGTPTIPETVEVPGKLKRTGALAQASPTDPDLWVLLNDSHAEREPGKRYRICNIAEVQAAAKKAVPKLLRGVKK